MTGWARAAAALAAAIMTAGGCASAPGATGGEAMAAKTDVVYAGPRFWALDAPVEEVAAVRVDADGVVVALYDAVPDAATLGGARLVRLDGAFALPGLHDAHLHVTWLGRAAETVDLKGARSAREAGDRVRAFAAAHPEVRVVTGSGWDHTGWDDVDGFPTAADLAGVARPVVLWRVDGHAVWVNEAALPAVRAHLSGGAREGERVIVDAAGAPTGVVVDPTEALTASWAVEPSAAELARWVRTGLERCAAAGLVEVHDMATSVAELEAMAAQARAEGLPVRVNVYLDTDEASWAWLAGRPPGPVAVAPGLRVLGVKVFADGALGSRGAALAAPYHDEPGHSGLLRPYEQVRDWVARAHAGGRQVAIHAIGDLANRRALDAFAEARAAGGAKGLRHRVEHAQVLAPADVARFVALGAVASMQPTHATSDMRWAEDRLGPERIRWAYAWHTVEGAGIPVAFGSDAPVEGVSPLLGVYAAITRQDADGRPPGGWYPEERVSLPAAIRHFTQGAAYAAHAEGRAGRLAVGYPFDVTLLDRDPRDAADAWLAAEVVGTIVAGRVRYRHSNR